MADFVRQKHYVRQFLTLDLCFELCAFFIGGLYLCQFVLWCFACFFWDPRRSRSRRGSCQVWFFGTTRAESLQNFIIRTRLVATGRFCLSKPLCPTIFNCRIVFWIMLFWYRKVVRVSVYSMMFRKFFWDPRWSRSRRGPCQLWCFRSTRAESLQNFIISKHMVATGTLCLSKPKCPTISNLGILGIVFWSMCFFHRRVVLVSVYSMMFWMFFLVGHVPVVGPVKCGFSESHQLRASETSS